MCIRDRTVKDIMHKGKDFPKVRPTALLSNALLEISKKGLGIVAVVYKNKLEGVFTDGDLRRSVESKIDLHNTKISSVMSKKAKTIEEESLAIHAAKIMQDNQIYVLIVLNSKRSPVGVIRMHDLMLSGLV